MSSVRTRLIHCFSAVFPELSERQIVSATADSVGSWDSLKTITLAAVVEEEFGIVFEAEELMDLTGFAAIERKLSSIRA